MSARSLSVALVLLASCGDDRPEATLPEIDPRHSFLGPGTGEGRLVWTGAELGYATSRRFYRFTMDGEMLSDWALADRYPVSLDLTGENYGVDRAGLRGGAPRTVRDKRAYRGTDTGR